MIEKAIKLYEYDELSESAKKKIREEWRNDPFIMDGYNSDYRNTLDEFCELCGIKMSEWEVSDWTHSFRINFGEKYPYEICDKDGYVDEYLSLDCLSGKLLFRYVLHNIIPPMIRGKCHSTRGYYDENRKYHYKWRRSCVVMEDEPEKGNCPLTGCCTDSNIIEPLMKYYRGWAKYPADYTFGDLMNECLESFFSAWESGWEYQLTDEAIDECIEANDNGQLYFANGIAYNGELDHVAA